MDVLSLSSTIGDSFNISETSFTKGDIRISAHGVDDIGLPKTFNEVDADDLELGDTIGRGCSSYVQIALHRKTGQQFAVKVINMFDKAKREQLISEIQALYDADCDALVTFFGSFFRQGKIYVVLEYMNLGSLDAVIAQRGPIPEDILAAMAYQILWGLSYLKHERRLHRDIKPQNILLNSEGEVKLTDFGISKELDDTVGQVMSFVGTFKYMSPERVETQPYGFSSDIWSLGLSLIECATGEYPYAESSTYIDMVQTILETPAPRLSAGEFSEDFCGFITECMQKAPERRLESEILMGSPWIQNCGFENLEDAQLIVQEWIEATNPTFEGKLEKGGSKYDEGSEANSKESYK